MYRPPQEFVDAQQEFSRKRLELAIELSQVRAKAAEPVAKMMAERSRRAMEQSRQLRQARACV